MYLRINRRHMRCDCCDKKFREELPFVKKNRNYTTRFATKVIQEVIASDIKNVAQRILKKLGLKLEFKYWRGNRQTKQRVYSGCHLNPDERNAVFEEWLARDAKLSTTV